MSKTKITLSITILLLAIVGGVWFFTSKPKSQQSNQPAQNTSTQLGQSTTQAVDTSKLYIGNPAAPVTIVEYGDFQCPICKRFFEQTEPSLRRQYIDTNKAKIEFRIETHLGEESITAGEAAYCANEQAAFPAYHDELYKVQSGINDGAFSQANLKQIAAKLNLDTGAFNTCLDNGKYRQTVINSNAEAQARGVNATPTFYIGEQKIVGAQPLSIFEPVINGQL